MWRRRRRLRPRLPVPARRAAPLHFRSAGAGDVGAASGAAGPGPTRPGLVLSGPVRSDPIRSGPVRPGPAAASGNGVLARSEACSKAPIPPRPPAPVTADRRLGRRATEPRARGPILAKVSPEEWESVGGGPLPYQQGTPCHAKHPSPQISGQASSPSSVPPFSGKTWAVHDPDREVLGGQKVGPKDANPPPPPLSPLASLLLTPPPHPNRLSPTASVHPTVSFGLPSKPLYFLLGHPPPLLQPCHNDPAS